MALEIKIKVEENCDSLYIYDYTGSYDKKCNETGWGRPNPVVSDAESAEFHIYPPNNEAPIILDVSHNLPSDSKEGLEILPEDLNMEKFKSGIWRFDYFVRVNGQLYTVSCSKLLIEDLKCCVYGKQVSVTVDNFESKEVEKSNNIIALFKSAVKNAKAGKISEAEKIIKFLYTKCKCSC